MEINSTPKLNTLRSLNDSKTYITVMWNIGLISSVQRVVASQLRLRTFNFPVFVGCVLAFSIIIHLKGFSRKIHQTFDRPPTNCIIEIA